MGEAEKRTAKGKSMVATFKQCARYLNPLFKFCRKKVLPDDIRQALLVVVECCMKRDYLAAMDHYNMENNEGVNGCTLFTFSFVLALRFYYL
ncbi:pre-mRNA-splicing factor 18 isoform X1 [Gossypium hirsutum]|uniref:Pre-mRNA-splicing factor 18 n=1 Tax=Gossypium hirsutum TaxID=3635 RepID=A0ABM3A5P1_GOSHI|nr:pre-mRNA-splicing factor 18-like isoform X1 [Gossypium hirsutum]